MNTRTRGVMIRVMYLMVGVSLLTGMAGAETTTLADLPLLAQTSISEAIGQDLTGYRIRATQIGGEAENAEHGVTAYFDGVGMTVRSGADVWRFELMQWGYDAALQPVAEAAPEIMVNRVTLCRDALIEWFVNGPSGVQQGFTLVAPPAETVESAPLTLTMRLTGPVPAIIESDQHSVLLGNSGLRYAGLYVYDSAGQELSAWFELAGEILLVRVDDRNAQYPLTIDPWVQQQKLTANNGAPEECFGRSVAVSGDTAIIGVSQADIGNNTHQGAVYVFVRRLGVWVQQQILTADDGMPGDYFGSSVAISEDTAVIGAPEADVGSNSHQGAVYVFTRSGSVWTQQTKLTTREGMIHDNFGFSVAVSGDTLVVGAPYMDISGTADQGAAYVFIFRSGSFWISQGKLTASDGALEDYFGYSVAISGDTTVIGAPGVDIGNIFEKGASYVFVRSDSTWDEQQKLTANDGTMSDWFGSSVAISGDTAVVGAYRADIDGKSLQGAAYVFARNGSAWTPQQKLTSSDGTVVDYFGLSVAVSGDTAVVGAYGAGNTYQGEAYVFIRTGDIWTQQQILKADDGATSDWFGHSVAVSGDTAVVGAHMVDIGVNADQGAAYVFVRSGSIWNQQQKLMAGGAPHDEFGHSVAIDGDTIVVGADDADVDGTIDQGAAYVFARNGSAWTQQQTLTASDGAASDYFGYSVAVNGDTVVVGADGADIDGNPNQGAAYVFIHSGGVWTLQQTLTASDGAAGDEFGTCVALSGDTAVVGAPLVDIGGHNFQGAAYVFVRSGSAWIPQGKLTAGDGAAYDYFGRSVAVNGDTAVVGVPEADIGGNDYQGAAYVFVRSGSVWIPQGKLTASDGTTGDYFGASVALSGDTAVIGAYYEEVGGNLNQGAAYVFVRGGGVWTLQQKLTAGDGDYFGYSVAISEDTVVVGAPLVDIGGNDYQGAAYIFVRSGSVWSLQQTLTASDGAAGDEFGIGVGVSGETAVVGAHYANVGGSSYQGVAYVFVFHQPNFYLLWTK